MTSFPRRWSEDPRGFGVVGAAFMIESAVTGFRQTVFVHCRPWFSSNVLMRRNSLSR